MEGLNFDGWTCPLPLRDHPHIVIGHGGGGKLSAELIEHLILPAFRNPTLEALADAATLTVPAGRLAITTDSFVVKPLFFPGGSIGDLAINGTVNDLAMAGAVPRYLTVGLILEEGLSLATLAGVLERMKAATAAAGVQIVAGDTKVVEQGHGDGMYINTSGIGFIPPHVQAAPANAQPGDLVIVSGTLGDHGMAIMSVREGLEFETTIESDCAPLHGLVTALLNVTHDIHVLRDPTRGGAASALNEIAAASGVGIVIEERRVPVADAVRSACELLGMDPLYVANEGKLIAIVPPGEADAVLDALRAHPLGKNAAIIGQVTAAHPGIVAAKTGLGASRVVDRMVGEQLPRIC